MATLLRNDNVLKRKNKRRLPSDCFFPTEKRQARVFPFQTPAPPKNIRRPWMEECPEASVEEMANLKLEDDPPQKKEEPQKPEDRPPIVRMAHPNQEGPDPDTPLTTDQKRAALAERPNLASFATTADGQTYLVAPGTRLPPSLKVADGFNFNTSFGGFDRLTADASPTDKDDRAPTAPRQGCSCGACRCCLRREVSELRRKLLATTERLVLTERRMQILIKNGLADLPFPKATKPLLPLSTFAMLADQPSSRGMDEDEQMPTDPPQPKPMNLNVKKGSIRKVWEQASKYFSKMSFNWLGKKYKLNVLNNFVLGNGVCIYAVELNPQNPDDSREPKSTDPMFDTVPGMRNCPGMP